MAKRYKYLNLFHVFWAVLLYLSIKQQHWVAAVPDEGKKIKLRYFLRLHVIE